MTGQEGSAGATPPDPEESLASDAETPPATESAGQGIPRWMTIVILALIVAILGVVAALAYSVFTEKEVPINLAQRDIVLYRDQVAKKPQDVKAHLSLGQAYYQNKQYAEAIREADKIIKLQENNVDALLLKGMAQRMSNSFDAALGTFDQIIALAPADAEARYQKGITLLAKKDVKGATVEFEAAIKTQPGAADIRVALGALYEQQGSKDKAVEQYKAALQYVPDYAAALAALQRLGVK
ncbi:MAG: tetratricopeptide repeat protein [Actinobacteria bacterium]|nr:tetratricopeptide repeat protein [Actinomycetota bacterium]